MAEASVGGSERGPKTLDPKQIAWLTEVLGFDPTGIIAAASGESGQPDQDAGDDGAAPAQNGADNGQNPQAAAPASADAPSADTSSIVIVNAGEKAWTIVADNAPNSDRASPLANALPKGRSASDLTWPAGDSIHHSIEEPGIFKFDINFQWDNGSYNGKGLYINDLAAYASGEVAAKGFFVTIMVDFTEPENRGSADDPVAYIKFGLSVKVRYDNKDAGIYQAHGFACADKQLGGRITDDWTGGLTVGIMKPDCKLVRGRVPGPKQHVMCGTHGHIINTDNNVIIANDLDEYKRLYPRGKQ